MLNFKIEKLKIKNDGRQQLTNGSKQSRRKHQKNNSRQAFSDFRVFRFLIPIPDCLIFDFSFIVFRFWIYDSQFRFMFLLLSKIAFQLFICRFVDVRFQNFDLGFPTYVSSDSVWTRPRSLDCSELMISAINTWFVFQLLVSVFVSFLIFSFDMLVVA